MVINPPKQCEQKLFDAIAYLGKFPACILPRLIPSVVSLKKVLTGLMVNGIINICNNDGISGYRLSLQGVEELLAIDRLAYAPYIGGEASCNIECQTDALTMAEIYTTMHNAGVSMLKDMKQYIYPHPFDVQVESPCADDIAYPSFYSQQELCENDTETTNAIRNSKLIGLLLTSVNAFAIYSENMLVTNWRTEKEQQIKNIVQGICEQRFPNQYDNIDGIVFGVDLGEMFCCFEENMYYNQSAGNCLSTVYQPLYCITNDVFGEMQLQLLCDSDYLARFKSAALSGLCPCDGIEPIVYDAITEDDRPVLFGCIPDVQKLIAFKSQLSTYGKIGRIIIFDFQKSAFGSFFGDSVELVTLNSEHAFAQFCSKAA